MKNRLFLLSLYILLAVATSLQGKVHSIRIGDPETWSATVLSQIPMGDSVRFDKPIYLCNNGGSGGNNFAVAPHRFYTPSNQEIPNTEAYEVYQLSYQAGRFTLTNVPQNPQSHTYRRSGETILNLLARVESGHTLRYLSGTWSGNSRQDLEKGYDRAAIDAQGTHEILVCAMNCEYYLTEAFDSHSSMGPNSHAEHQKQRKKVGAALAKINADLYGLVEIQQGQGALAEIAADLTAATGRHFTYISDNSSVDGTYTKSGYVYCSDVLVPYKGMVEVNDEVKNRKKMQLFRYVADEEKQFIYSINHFKSKSGNGSGLDADQHDGQGSYNNRRIRESKAVEREYVNLALLEREPDILIMGDLNAYGMEDPITELTMHGMTDLHRYFHADSSYSYTFGGQAGYLDHALCNSTMLAQVTGMTAYHINSDENDCYTYDSSNDLSMFRCSDHDPVLVGLRLQKGGNTEVFIPLHEYDEYYDCMGRPVAESELRSGTIYIVREYGMQGNKNVFRTRKIIFRE